MVTGTPGRSPWRRRLGLALRVLLIAAALLLAAIQFVPVERTNPPVLAEVEAPDDVAAILERACYDCHSHRTRWPWYAYVAPVSWLVADDVEHGRDDLNFSDWPLYDLDGQEHAFEEIREEISEGEMPLWSYTLLHREARLTDEERDRLVRWASP